MNAVSIAPAPSLRLGNLNPVFQPALHEWPDLHVCHGGGGTRIRFRFKFENSRAGICRWAEQMAAAWSYRFGTQDGNAIADSGIEELINHAATF